VQARREILLAQNSDLNCSLKANRARGWSGERSENKGLPLFGGESRSRGRLGLPYGRSAHKIINKTKI